MTKHTLETKLKAVQDYLEGKDSYKGVARKYDQGYDTDMGQAIPRTWSGSPSTTIYKLLCGVLEYRQHFGNFVR